MTLGIFAKQFGSTGSSVIVESSSYLMRFTRARVTPRAFLVFILSLLAFALPVAARAVTINIVSDTSWTVYDADGNRLDDPAQNVCLNATAPSNCPAGATLYGYPFQGWTANLSSIPGATWIWAPNITGTTAPAADAEFTFEKEFYLCGAPQPGTISVAADNSAEVSLNGVSVLTATEHATLSTVNIPATSFAQGRNILQIKVRNGANPSDCGSGQYRCNPAGFVVGASFADALPALPICRGNGGRTFTVGQFEPLTCPAGKVGSPARPCICIGANGLWGPTFGRCDATCTGSNGATFIAGQTETIACAAGETGLEVRTCGQTGNWSVTSNTCRRPAPTCTGTNGTVFNAGATETLSCPADQVGSRTRTCGPDGNWGPTSGACSPTCEGNDGTGFRPGDTETLSCPAPQTGSQSRVCGPDGRWGPTSSTCERRPGDLCGSRERGVIQPPRCPAGTTCQSRQLPTGPKPWTCFLFNINCPVRLVTTDWFCDP